MPIGKSNGNGATAEVAKTAPAPVARALQTAPAESKRELNTGGNEASLSGKDRDDRILRSGVYQAVLQSPGLAALPIVDEASFLKTVERVSEAIIEKVQGK